MQNIDYSFDSQLNSIPGLNKNWLPWIGANFKFPNKNQLLIVSESNYLTDDIDVTQKDYMRKLIEKDGTQEGEWYKENQYIGKRHKILEDIMSVNKLNFEDKSAFWSKVAYYNLIQVPLDSRTEEDRPDFTLYLEGINVLYQRLDILKPCYCLMNGVESWNHFHEKIANDFGYTIKEKVKLDKIGNAYPRRIILENKINNSEVKLLFIQHTSRTNNVNSWKEWVYSELV